MDRFFFTVCPYIALVLFMLLGGVPEAFTPDASSPGKAGLSVDKISLISMPPLAKQGCNVPTSARAFDVEPTIAVNPSRPKEILVSWQQDTFADEGLGAYNEAADVSTDGGATWSLHNLPGLTKCTLGRETRTADVWSGWDTAGNAYVSSLSYTPESTQLDGPTVGTIFVNKLNHGEHFFRPPVAIDVFHKHGSYGFDKPVLATSPYAAGSSYLVWTLTQGIEQELRFASTKDWGRQWSAPTRLHATPLGQYEFPSCLLVLPDRSILLVFTRSNLLSVDQDRITTNTIYGTRSIDGGRTWHSPIKIADATIKRVTDPETGLSNLAGPEIVSASASSDGTLFVVWEDNRAAEGKIMISSSTTQGRSWRAPSIVHVGQGAVYTPTVAVSKKGGVAVMWYDTRSDKPSDDELSTDWWAAYSSDHAAHWRETHIAGPFDLRATRRSSSFRLGEYFGLTGLDDMFVAALVMSRPLAQYGSTDIFFVRMTAK